MTRPGALSGAALVRAAVRLADERGIDAVTMRGLGAQVGVGAMALYNYVTGREALLDAMVADLLDELAPQLKPDAPACVSRAAYLERIARKVRVLALAHPWLIRLMVTRPPLDPSLSATLAAPAALACTDSVLSALADHHAAGQPAGTEADADGVRTFRAFAAFLLGHLLLEIPVPAVEGDRRARDQARAPSATRRAQLPTRLNLLRTTEPGAEFDRSLQIFLSTLSTPSTHETLSTPSTHETLSTPSTHETGDGHQVATSGGMTLAVTTAHAHLDQEAP